LRWRRYTDLVAASEESRQVEHPWQNILALVPLEIRSPGPNVGVVGDLPAGDPTGGTEHQHLRQHAPVPLHYSGDNNCLREEEENSSIHAHTILPQVCGRPLALVPLHRSTLPSSCSLRPDLNHEYLSDCERTRVNCHGRAGGGGGDGWRPPRGWLGGALWVTCGGRRNSQRVYNVA
jgi:hypothetical protein